MNKIKDRWGSFVIFPTHFEGSKKEIENIFKSIGEPYAIESSDINRDIQDMFEYHDFSSLQCRIIRKQNVSQYLIKKESPCCLLNVGEYNETILIDEIVVFKCQMDIAFVCVLLSCKKIEMLEKVCHPGYESGNVKTSFVGNPDIDLESVLRTWFETIHLNPFYTDESLFLDAFIYNFGLFTKRFSSINQIRNITFNMHLMAPLESVVHDSSEEDISYVYAVKDYNYNSYRWGCCISSQTISYATGDEKQTFDEQIKEQERNGLLLVILALHKKYACLHLEHRLNSGKTNKIQEIENLKKQMTEFRAYGMILPDYISRWNNIKMIYKKLLINLGVYDMLENLTYKLEILSSEQESSQRKRIDRIVFLITMLGLFSVLDSAINIIELVFKLLD